MRKELMIFGAGGALGCGITDVMLKKDYDKIYLLDFKLEQMPADRKTEFIKYGDLSVEENIKEVFNRISPGKDKHFFLYSTVGGFFGGKKVWETGFEEWDKMQNMNLKTSFLIAKYFSLLVKESGGGCILFTSAYTALDPEKGKSAYGASKRGLLGLIETLALEGEEINLTANAIAPYIIDTPANRQWGSEEDAKGWIRPEEIGEFAHSVFVNYRILSGNVFRLKIRIKD